MENVEDKDDIVAANYAVKEQQDVILEEDMKMDTTDSKGLDDENPEIDRSMLPPIYNYGLAYVESLQEGSIIEEEQTNGMEIEKNEEENEVDEISEEEEIDFNNEPEEDSEDDEETRVAVIIFIYNISSKME